MLTIKNLQTELLSAINFNLNAGECVGISGPSGCGKTRLLRAIADLDPHQGEIWLDDQLQSETRPCLWRHQVTYVPAESSWWADTVGEHFEAYDAERFSRLGFDEQVMEWQLSRCSTGEKQRLALLRALQHQPAVLLLDEPTASLDKENIGRVEQLMRDYQQQGHAILWVGHDGEQLQRLCDRIYRIQQHKLELAA